jgi:hypothetical protein
MVSQTIPHQLSASLWIDEDNYRRSETHYPYEKPNIVRHARLKTIYQGRPRAPTEVCQDISKQIRRQSHTPSF